MGNVNNIWYYKDSGEDWANTKCSLDSCYSIPFDKDLDTDLHLQVDFSHDYTITEIWLADLNGNRIKNILPDSDIRFITGISEGVDRLIFKVPADSGACMGSPVEVPICTAQITDTEGDDTSSYFEDYNNNVNNVSIFFVDTFTGTEYDIEGNVFPPGFQKLSPTLFRIPCDINTVDIPNNYYGYDMRFYSDAGNLTTNWPKQSEIVETTITEYTGPTLSCFRFEIPLLQDGEEAQTLLSEPFSCPDCVPTVKISSDYCLNPSDIFGDFFFKFGGLGDVQSGNLVSAKNDFRIQAVLKKLPSQIKNSLNSRCNNFKSTLKQRYRLQGAMPIDFPDYMVTIMESIFSGKKVYIDGEQYLLNTEQIFTERNTPGYSMKKLDMELVKCEKAIAFDCSCVVDCDTEPAGMVISPAPNYTNTVSNDYNGVDHTFYKVILYPTTGTPPYTYGNWFINGQVEHNDDIETWVDNREYNYVRRIKNEEDDLCPRQLTMTVDITDANGCSLNTGLTIDMPDMRCADFGASISIGTVTSNSIQILDVTNPSGGTPSCYDFSVDALQSGFPVTGITTFPHTITGLAPNTQYEIVARMWCGDCPGDLNAALCVDCEDEDCTHSGLVGPINVTTMP